MSNTGLEVSLLLFPIYTYPAVVTVAAVVVVTAVVVMMHGWVGVCECVHAVITCAHRDVCVWRRGGGVDGGGVLLLCCCCVWCVWVCVLCVCVLCVCVLCVCVCASMQWKFSVMVQEGTLGQAVVSPI